MIDDIELKFKKGDITYTYVFGTHVKEKRTGNCYKMSKTDIEILELKTIISEFLEKGI